MNTQLEISDDYFRAMDFLCDDRDVVQKPLVFGSDLMFFSFCQSTINRDYSRFLAQKVEKDGD